MLRAVLFDGSRLAWNNECESVAAGALYVSPNPPPVPIIFPPLPTNPDGPVTPPPLAVAATAIAAAATASATSIGRFRFICNSFPRFIDCLLTPITSLPVAAVLPGGTTDRAE